MVGALDVPLVGSYERSRGRGKLAVIACGLAIVLCLAVGLILESPAQSTELDVAASPSESSKVTCFQHTGGTCFLSACDSAYRGSEVTCVPELLVPLVSGRSAYAWRACICSGDKPCAHYDGKCYAQPELENPKLVLLRKETSVFVAIGLVPLVRGGIVSQFLGILKLNKLTSFPNHVKTHFYVESTVWNDWVEQYYVHYVDGERVDGWYDAFFTSLVKMGCLHLSQVILFWVPFYAYYHFMGSFQFFFARIVVIKEAWYGFLVFLGCWLNPSFLLFAAEHERDWKTTLQYFLDPDLFIAQCIAKQKVADGLFDSHPLVAFTATLSGCAGLAAMLAIWAGLFHDGVMFPSLFVGYILASLAPCVFPLIMVGLGDASPEQTKSFCLACLFGLFVFVCLYIWMVVLCGDYRCG